MAFALRQPYQRRAPVAEDTGVAGDVPAARPSRTRVAAARGAGAVGSAMIVLARLVRLVAGVIAAVLVVAILLRVLSANPGNALVRDIHDAGRALAGPFRDVFSVSNPKVAIAINWGLAAVAYLIVGSLIARAIARLAPRGWRSVA